MSAPKARRKLDRAAREVGRLLDAARDGRVVRERLVELPVARVDGERLRGRRAVVLVLQVELRRAQRVQFGRVRVDAQPLLDLGGSFLELARFEFERGG